MSAKRALERHSAAVPVHLQRACHWPMLGTSGATQSPNCMAGMSFQIYLFLPQERKPAQNLHALMYRCMVGYMAARISVSP